MQDWNVHQTCLAKVKYEKEKKNNLKNKSENKIHKILSRYFVLLIFSLE